MMDPRTRYLAGLTAETQVARHYTTQGYRVVSQRWRGGGGEIDLVLEDGFGAHVFVEVKKSRSHDRAATRVSPAQIGRLCAAAQAFLARTARGLNTLSRFDVALVDSTGRIDVIENAIAA